MNEENLIPNNRRSPTEVRENGRKGGIASGKARREKADLRKLAQLWLEEDCGFTDKNGKPMTGAELTIRTAVREMVKGSIQHMVFIRDTAGYKPVEKVAIADIDQATMDEVESLVKEFTSMKDSVPPRGGGCRS